MAGPTAASSRDARCSVGLELGGWGVPGGPPAYEAGGSSLPGPADGSPTRSAGDYLCGPDALRGATISADTTFVQTCEPREVPAVLAEARALVDAGRHEEALIALSDARLRVPGCAEAHDAACLLGSCHAARGAVAASLASFASALALRPGSADALIGTVRVLRSAGSPARALALLEDAMDAAIAGSARATNDEYSAEVPLGGAKIASYTTIDIDANAVAGLGVTPSGVSGPMVETDATQALSVVPTDGTERAAAVVPGEGTCQSLLPRGAYGQIQEAPSTLSGTTLPPSSPAGPSALSLVPETSAHKLLAARAVRLCLPLREELAACLTDAGTAEKALGVPGWEVRYEAALWVHPVYAPSAYNLGVSAGERGDLTRAVACYRTALALMPGHVESACNLGVALRGLGREREATDAFRVALASAPGHPALRANAAAALTAAGAGRARAGDPTGALEDYHAALALLPRHGEALYNAGVAYAELGQLDRAVFMYELAVEAVPSCAEAWNNLGIVLRERGDVDRAAACYEAALRARPDFAQGLNNAAVLATQRGDAGVALDALRAALTVSPTYAEAWNNLGVLQRDVGTPRDAIASYERCLELDPTNRNAGQNRLLALNYVAGGETVAVCEAHAQWGRELEARIVPMPALVRGDVDADPDRVLTVGYVSPDLHTHSVSYFAEAPLTHHDSSCIRVIVYDACARGDVRTERLRTATERAGGTWRHVASLPERDLAKLIRADRVDILVDLTGHTAGNRLGTFAVRPAPVAVTWIGYPNSTGMSRVDWRITDATSDPVGSRQTYAERLWRLPGCFLCYTPSPTVPTSASTPALARGYVTFGSFNALAKQTPEVLRVWARILRALPSTRLVLKNKPFACAATRERHWRAWEALGVRRARVDLLPLAREHADHLSQYAIIDIALDPWPYAGTTTTAECLLMGVPCVTRRGRCHAHNVGASLLEAASLRHGWVADSEDEYVSAAVALAQLDASELDAVRATTRRSFLASPLCDGRTFVRGLEEAYRGMWHDWLTRHPAGDGDGDGDELGGVTAAAAGVKDDAAEVA